MAKLRSSWSIRAFAAGRSTDSAPSTSAAVTGAGSRTRNDLAVLVGLRLERR
ncbi:MAG: hypothetical protein KF689_14210 [Gemmatimonadaceae bacterium]|nr:hypothetical protein [Gemmatimonadaceae bacterium]MCW5826859.1 hypothetical protein [Gemmatimonadaceae bacterium]